jgi:hypothetical protein
MGLAFFGFLTGLHLALLQFGYLFLLVIHISSTYVTYAMIVLAWMSGTLIGLRWRGLDGRAALALGLLGYYATYGLVVNDAPVPSLAFAALGVAASGLWAGRFFVVMLPHYGRADRLFFHENNGFLVGVIAAFVGFTMLGRPFLFWTPLVMGAGLLIQLMAIESGRAIGGARPEVESP